MTNYGEEARENMFGVDLNALQDISKYKKKPLKTMESLVPDEVIEAAALVMTKALETGHHSKDEWRSESSDHQYDCMMRHLRADRKGLTRCEDFGLPHLYHFMTRAMLYVALKMKEGNWKEGTR